MSYQAPTSEYQYIFDNIVPVKSMIEFNLLNSLDIDEFNALLELGGKIAEEEISPLQRSGDKYPARLENGVVYSSPGFAESYQKVAGGGWIGMSSDSKYGGLGLPYSLRGAFTESLNGACMAFALNPMLTQCQIDALEEHGSQQIKSLYLPRLNSGEWSGTMNISEPQAGSDVGAIRTQAEPNDDGTFRINGEKIYISWADADFVSNVCHLILARLPNSAAGSKGLTLFLAPKFIPNEKGGLGERNNIHILSLEQKLGIHGSPTAVVKYDDARAWIIGKPNGGLAAMFTMMNNARLGVGLQGVGVADAAWQMAREYASQRKQGKSKDGHVTNIAAHPNIRITLAKMQAMIFAARSVCALCAYGLDMAKLTGDEKWISYASALTPIAKAFGSDTAVEVSINAIQIHGGSGYIEDTGVAQYLRDSLVSTIYEGTNDIQALDLVGRKLDEFKGINIIIEEINSAILNSKQKSLREDIKFGLKNLENAIITLMDRPPQDRIVSAVPFLKSMALAIGGKCHLIASESGGFREALAKVYFERCLSNLNVLCQETELKEFDINI